MICNCEIIASLTVCYLIQGCENAISLQRSELEANDPMRCQLLQVC